MPAAEDGIPEGAGGTTLRAMPSPLGTVPGLALGDWGVETPAVGKPLERPMAAFTEPTFWPAKVDGTGIVPFDIWPDAEVAANPSEISDKASSLIAVSFLEIRIPFNGCASA